VRGPAGFTNAAAQLVGIGADADRPRMNLSRFAVVQAERLPASARSDLEWVPFGDEVRLDLTIRSSYDDISFNGRIMTPPRKRGDKVRLSVREYEMLLTDASQADNELGSTPVRYRLVYADHFDV
jgi:hypothetical protein